MDASQREAIARQRLRLSRVLIGSAATIGVAAIVAIGVVMTFAVPLVSRMFAERGESFAFRVTGVLVPVFEFIGDWLALALLVAVVLLWRMRKRGMPRFLELGAGPLLTVVTIVALLTLVAISLEYAMAVPRLAGELVYRHERSMISQSRIDRSMRLRDYDSAIRQLDTLFANDLWYSSMQPARAQNRLLRAEAYGLKGDTANADSSYAQAIAEIKSLDLADREQWIRVVEESKARVRPRQQINR